MGRSKKLHLLIFGLLVVILGQVTAPASHARNLDAVRRRFALLHGIDYLGQGHLHTEPRRGPQGAVQARQTDKIRISWSTSVQERHAFTTQSWSGSLQNLNTTAIANLRIEVLRSPLVGLRAGMVDVVKTLSLGTVEANGKRQVFISHRYANTDPSDYQIRVHHD